MSQIDNQTLSFRIADNPSTGRRPEFREIFILSARGDGLPHSLYVLHVAQEESRCLAYENLWDATEAYAAILATAGNVRAAWPHQH